MKTPQAFQIVLVTWEDAKVDGAAQHESPDAAARTYKPCLRKSVGFWVGWGVKGSRRVAMIGMDDDRNEESPDAIGGVAQIPRGMILSIDPIPQPKKRR